MVVKIGNKFVGKDQPCFVVGEIGINHNGSLAMAKRLIDLAVVAGCGAVKFQKRTVEVVYTSEELAKPRENPFGSTNGDLKRGLEFGEKEYDQIDYYCKEKGILWFASPWDEASVDFLERYSPPCYKVASASLTDADLLRHIRSKGRPVILSTGMSNMEMVCKAVDLLGTEDLIILHCTSAYSSLISINNDIISTINLRAIDLLRTFFHPVPIGFSSHDSGKIPSLAAVSMGACVLEKHITMDRSLWGSDQASSMEPHELIELCQWIRVVEQAMGDGVKKIYPAEVEVMKKLRRKDTL